MSSDGGNADIALVVGFGAGLFLFFKGFRIYREYRVLMDTPEMPIRSIAMGLVEVHGKAVAPQTVASPVTQTPCCFYKVDVERWVRGKNGGHWSHAATDADGMKFYLEDPSGKVLVDAHHAEYDLLQNARQETRGGMGIPFGRLFSGMNNPTLTTRTATAGTDLFTYAQSVVSGGHRSISLDGGNPGEGLLSSLEGSFNLGGGSSDRYRLSEYLILPGHWYDLAGTCVENPQPQDEHDRNLIMKGTNEPTFLISWRSEKELKRTLRNRAATHIFGGAFLSVACLGIILLKFGWL